MKKIAGKVARILNSREMALNIGSADGVKVGMLFDVLDPAGEDIRDPVTQEVLGSIERAKVRVKVMSVQDRLCVASTFRSTTVNIGGEGLGLATSAFSNLFLPPKYETRFETLKTDEKTWEDLDEEQSYVKTGDPVVSVEDFDAKQ